MAATTPNPKIDRYKLQTVVHDDGACVVHTSYRTDLSSHERRVAVETKWTEKKALGSGGFGDVTLQEDEAGNLRAVKQLFYRKGVNYSMELRALSKVSDRPDLFVKFLGWYDTSHSLYIAMEFIEHGDLSMYMKAGGAKLGSNSREITRQVLEGLAVLHSKNICHRDLKPQNILIASPQPIWVKIADFGASKYLKGTELYTRVGTQGYLAPEVLGVLPHSGSYSYTNAVDLWALGCIVYEMLTSKIPFHTTAPTVSTDISGLESETGSSFTQTDIMLLHSFCLGQIPLPVEDLQNAGDSAIAFVKCLLLPGPSTRISASAALQMAWLLETDGVNDKVKQHRGQTSMGKGAKRDTQYQPSGQSLLSAASEGHSTIVELLLDRGADIKACDEEQHTALALAAMNGHTETVALLLDRGAELTACNTYGDTAMLIAALYGHLKTVELLLDRGAELTEHNQLGETALLCAVQNGHIKTVEFLLDRGADIKACGMEQDTALGLAAINGETETVALLLDRGAELTARNTYGRTAMLIAALYGHLKTVELLLDRGAELTERDQYGKTALLCAVQNGHIKTVEFLLDRGADIKARGIKQTTALGFAAWNGYTEIVELLLDRGADIEEKNQNQETALVIAASKGHTDVVTFLLDYEAEMRLGINHGSTDLLSASPASHINASGGPNIEHLPEQV